MGRILVIAAAVVAALFVAGWLLGLLFNALKWLLVLAVLAAVGYAALKLAGLVRSDRTY